MKTLFLITSTLFLLLSISCRKDNPTTIQIRIKNNTQLNFEKVVVKIDDEKTYNNIRIGKSSEYQIYNVAYKYAYIKVITKNGEFVFQPYDYVGEKQLENGRHTYILSLDNQNSANLNITYMKD